MDFLQSETRINLARSFAGESQARNRYTISAATARHENQEVIARLFEQTADNERVHAEEFLEQLTKYGPDHLGNITFQAGYPYLLGNTSVNLRTAMEGEWEEHSSAYPAFAKLALEEGFDDISRLWTMIAAIEGEHHRQFAQTLEELTKGTLYKKPQLVVWRCQNCGYFYTAASALEKCPVCSKPTGWMEQKRTPQQPS